MLKFATMPKICDSRHKETKTSSSVQTNFNKKKQESELVTNFSDVTMSAMGSRNHFSREDGSNSKETPKKVKKSKQGLPCLFKHCRQFKKSYVNFECHLYRVHRMRPQEYGEIFHKYVNKTTLGSHKDRVKKTKLPKRTGNGLRDVEKSRDRKLMVSDEHSSLRDSQNAVKGISRELRDNQKSFETKANDKPEHTDKVVFTVQEHAVTQELDYEVIRKEFSSHLRKVTYDLVQLTSEERFVLENTKTNLESQRQLQQNKMQKS